MAAVLSPNELSEDDDLRASDERKLNDIFDKMCQATSDEELHHLASQLRGAVDAVSTPSDLSIGPSHDMNYVAERGPAVTALTMRLQSLLVSRRLPERLASIAAITALIHTETESIHARAQRTANAVRLLFRCPVKDMPTAKAASTLVSTLADVDNPLSARAVEHVLTDAISVIGSRATSVPDEKYLLAVDRARAAMVITELASVNKAPKFVLHYQKYLRNALWDVIWDEDCAVREQGVQGMQAILKTVVIRADLDVSQKAMQEVVDSILSKLTPQTTEQHSLPQSYSGERSLLEQTQRFSTDSQNELSQSCPDSTLNDSATYTPEPISPSVIHGSLCMLGSLINSAETLPYMHALSSKICNFSLKFQAHPDSLVRKAVAEILPLLVRLNGVITSFDFLDKVHQSTMQLIKSSNIPSGERGHSLVSLASIWVQISTESRSSHKDMLEEMLSICRIVLYKTAPNEERIPHDLVLKTISLLAQVSHGNATFERVIRKGLLMRMFSTNFTSLLIVSVDYVRQAIPALDDFVHGCLVNLIAAFLEKGLPDKRTGKSDDSSALGNGFESGSSRDKPSISTNLLQSAEIDDNTISQNFSDFDSVRRAVTPNAGPRDFFKQYPFSSELQNIDSSSSLSAKSSTTALEGLLKMGPAPTSSPYSAKADFVDTYDAHSLLDHKNSPCVALKAIVNYEFKGMNSVDFTSFASEYVIGYVESNCVKTRALSVGASAKLMQSAVKAWKTSKRARSSARRLQAEIQTILVQLVLVAVADPSKDVRFVAIRSIDRDEFRPYLLQPEVLSTLFTCLHDESLGMRDSALSLIGRLGVENPAYVLPALRSYLNHLLVTLRLDGRYFSKQRREATELIHTLVQNAQDFLDPYIDVIIDSLILRLEDARKSHDTGAALPVLMTLAKMGGTTSQLDLKPYRESLVPLVVSYVLEVQSAEFQFRRAALRALAALVQNTGFVIRPYGEHPNLLPKLLEILRSETDTGVRLEVVALLGSLGAVDPDDHKYASLPMLTMGGRLSHHGRGLSSESQSKSLLRGASGRGSSNWAGSSSQRPDSGPGWRTTTMFGAISSSQGLADTGHPTEHVDHVNDSDERSHTLGSSSAMAARMEDVQPTLSWFSLGGVRLKKCIHGYVPEWSREELEYVSLVGQLDHPFTRNDDYFPSVLLDELHKLISSPRPRSHLREACQAIVNILRSVGPRCTYFLPEVVPRMLWLINQLTTNESLPVSFGANVKSYTIQKLSDIVHDSGQSFIPYAFDTILLVWNYLRYGKKSPSAIESFCVLLTRIRLAIGDEFKPAIATLLPVLLECLGEDKTPRGTVACAILATLESFCPFLEEYDSVVLQSLTEMFSMDRSPVIRKESAASLIRIVRSMDHVNALSNVVHPLVLSLAGISNSDRTKDGENKEFARVSDSLTCPDDENGMNCMAVMAALALYEIGMRSPRWFKVYVPVVTKALKNSCVKLAKPAVYVSLKNLLLERSPQVVKEFLEDDVDPTEPMQVDILPPRRALTTDSHHSPQIRVQPESQHVAEEELIQKWEVESHFKAEEWTKWIADLGVAMFQQSGCGAFRACVRISESYPTFTKNLFNPAFLSCWSSSITEPTKSRICSALDAALSSPTIPLNVLQALLNLFEFMDHDESPIQASLKKLSATAYRCGALAKALRYRERDYSQNQGNADRMLQEVVGDDGLIAIYEKLDHVESAVGTIYHYEKETGERLQEQWYEKLQRWDDALHVYETEMTEFDKIGDLFQNKKKWNANLGRLRCLNQMGEWRRMIELLHETREACYGNREALKELAIEGKALSVSFDLGRWDEFEEWLQYIGHDTYDGCFYSSILHIKQGKENVSAFADAEHCIRKAECLLDLELTARVSEGYPRAYSHVVRSQTLVELKEMISYLRKHTNDSGGQGRRRLLEGWNKRLAGCKRDRQTWYQVLMTRTLLTNPIENKSQWLEYAIMCRKAKLLPMASEVLSRLVSSYADTASPNETHALRTIIPRRTAGALEFNIDDVRQVRAIKDLDLKFACIKHLWARNKKMDAYRALEICWSEFLLDSGVQVQGSAIVRYTPEQVNDKKLVLAGEVFSKLSKWGHRLKESGPQNTSLADPLIYADWATRVRPTWYKAWHYWAVMNGTRFETLVEQRNTNRRPPRGPSNGNGDLVGDAEKKLLTKTIQGYFKAIDLCGKSRLEDSLKVLTLWFRYGGFLNMHTEFDKGFEFTNIDRWLEVVPQIIARLHTPFADVQRGVKDLLTRIGKAHPHVAVYPLTVAKSAGGLRQGMRSQAASEILEKLKSHHSEIVDQAGMVARELVRVAILWTEMWYEKLEEASRLYYVEHDVDGMIDTLAPLHAEVDGNAETLYEREFVAEFGRELREAQKLCRTYRAERNHGASEESLSDDIKQAWVIYTQVFKRIQRHQQVMQELHLEHVSNGLSDASSLKLAVPGTYNPDQGGAVVAIEQFNPQLHVLQSKQRPRKLSIIGSNGQAYQFLLKGHEDLRQDERVMQVFGLINKLFAKSEQRMLLNNVGLKTYAVIALSANAGLIEWVPDCDTMHSLVKNFREVRSIVPNIEHRVMLKCAPEPERLTLLQKVDLFEYMLQTTSGSDLARVIWLRSRNSEMWLDRRTTYSKSLAITSMVGYLLGLGDRHPSNIMIERFTGKIMHIDFGDCFEVAMKREKYPEKVPFRLTRMMVCVLEPCEVEGYFRHTCLATMDVLRQKNTRESLMSMMEAFVYDPLIRWKLLGAEELTQLQEEGQSAPVAQSEQPRVPRRERPPPAQGPDEANRADRRGDGCLAGLGSSLRGLGRDVPRDIDELVRSLNVTGSLSASVRLQEERERRQREEEQERNPERSGGEEEAEPEAVGAMATPVDRARGRQQAGSEMDRGEELLGVTPNQEARIRHARVYHNVQASFDRFTNEIQELSNARAQLALNRFEDKLNGTDYEKGEGISPLSVPNQVDLLIHDARNVENLCTLFLGWCAFW